MRFLLYNIRYATGRRTKRAWMDMLRRTNMHFDTITDFVKEVDPDVIGLVETDSGSFRTSYRSQPETLASTLGHKSSFDVKYKRDGWLRRAPVLNKQGNALLSRLDGKKSKFHFLSNGFKRLVIELELEDVSIFLVHLSLRKYIRKRQLAQLDKLVSQNTKPCIVAGDFNAFMGHAEISDFLSNTGLKQANQNFRPTYPSWSPRRVLDFVCYTPSIKLRSFQIPQVTFSDHLPIICDFDLPAKAG